MKLQTQRDIKVDDVIFTAKVTDLTSTTILPVKIKTVHNASRSTL